MQVCLPPLLHVCLPPFTRQVILPFLLSFLLAHLCYSSICIIIRVEIFWRWSVIKDMRIRMNFVEIECVTFSYWILLLFCSPLQTPHIAIHGSISFMVNLHSIKEYFSAMGGFSACTPYKDTFQVCSINQPSIIQFKLSLFLVFF